MEKNEIIFVLKSIKEEGEIDESKLQEKVFLAQNRGKIKNFLFYNHTGGKKSPELLDLLERWSYDSIISSQGTEKTRHKLTSLGESLLCSLLHSQ